MESQFQRIAESAELQCVDVVCGDALSSNELTYRTEESSGQERAAASRYLIASITKPIVAMAALKLVAEGEFTLSQRLGDLLPELQKGVYRKITPRHLLTHTSGFPDMLPNNAELRAAHAPLKMFVDAASTTKLEFGPGSDCRYSSIGFLLLGEIIEKIVGCPLARFLHDKFFRPLQMHESWLGLPESQADELMPTVLPSILPEWQPDAENWGWNSRYWRTLGAPWGGMISTAADLGRFLTMMLSDGAGPDGQQIIPREIVTAATADQLQPVAAQPGFVGPQRGWGFGWRRQWPAHFASFGDFVPPSTVGHWGATGTLAWFDPVASQFAVMLTTTPYEMSQPALQRISNIVAVAATN